MFVIFQFYKRSIWINTKAMSVTFHFIKNSIWRDTSPSSATRLYAHKARKCFLWSMFLSLQINKSVPLDLTIYMHSLQNVYLHGGVFRDAYKIPRVRWVQRLDLFFPLFHGSVLSWINTSNYITIVNGMFSYKCLYSFWY